MRLTVEQLRAALDYDAETGAFRWGLPLHPFWDKEVS